MFSKNHDRHWFNLEMVSPPKGLSHLFFNHTPLLNASLGRLLPPLLLFDKPLEANHVVVTLDINEVAQ